MDHPGSADPPFRHEGPLDDGSAKDAEGAEGAAWGAIGEVLIGGLLVAMAALGVWYLLPFSAPDARQRWVVVGASAVVSAVATVARRRLRSARRRRRHRRPAADSVVEYGYGDGYGYGAPRPVDDPAFRPAAAAPRTGRHHRDSPRS